jgi:chorismate--pyruvate lyase
VRGASLRQARWVKHANGVQAPARMRGWLLTPGSLTARLVAHSRSFRVQRLHQRSAICLPDEAGAIGLHRPGRVWEREVLLRCDDQAVVFAHTVVTASSNATDWPLFSALGERSLGTTLFYDPLVKRGQLEFARIRAGHPLLQRANAAVGGILRENIYYARRCLYRRHQGLLLVTEVFLPSVLTLAAAEPNTNTPLR